MNNLRDRLQRMMMGRYGGDDFSKALLGTAVGVMVINLLLRVRLLNAVVLGLLIYVYFRMFSRNFQARYAENAKYLALKDRVTGTFARSKRRAEDLKTNHIYKCPSCGQKIRVPRGRGRIIITCRKCGKEFEKKS